MVILLTQFMLSENINSTCDLTMNATKSEVRFLSLQEKYVFQLRENENIFTNITTLNYPAMHCNKFIC